MDQFSDRERIILGCCAGALVLCLFPWFSVSFGGESGMRDMLEGMGASLSVYAFESVTGVLTLLALSIAGGSVLASKHGQLPWPPTKLGLATLIAAGLAFVCALLFMAQSNQTASLPMAGFSAGRTFWYYATLLATAVAAVQSYLRWVDLARADVAPSATS